MTGKILIKRILVSRLRFMGDIVLTTPLLSALKTAYPNAHIDYLAESPYIDLLEANPNVDGLIKLPRKGQSSAFFKLIRNRYDLAIDLFGNPRSALLTYMSGAGIRIGGNFRGRRLLYTRRIGEPGQTLNAIDFHLRYLEPLNIEAKFEKPIISIKDEEKNNARMLLKKQGYDLNKPIIGLHIGATWPAKKWIPERFARVAEHLQKSMGYQLYFTAGPGELDDVCSVIRLAGVKANEPEILSLRSMAAVLSCLTLFVSNDCGPLHVAPAVDTTTIGIFGPGEPEIWFPYSEPHRYIHKEIDCSRCHKDLCEIKTCMKAIEVDDVIKEIKACLAQKS